jgi:calcineurin-like phosphoesterase family protein
MSKTWIWSDQHFGHEKTCTVFKREDGTPLRPFASAEEMNEVMVARNNERVSPNDRVYYLGDVVINRKFLKILDRLNGRKVLIKGNHDIFKLDDYAAYFDDIRAYHVLNGMIFSHVPVHPASLARFGCNIHGHLHANRVLRPSKIDRLGTSPCVEYSDEIDPNYYNVSVECTDFAPITLEDLYERIQAQGGHVGFRNGNGVQGVD